MRSCDHVGASSPRGPGRLEGANATGDLDVNGSGTIVFVGLGASRTVIDGDGIDRVFDLACRTDMSVQFFSMTGETLGSMLIAGNLDGYALSAPDCSTLATGTTSSGYNLIGAAGLGTCALSGDTTGNQIGVEVDLSQTSMIDAEMPYAAPRFESVAIGAVPRLRCRLASGDLVDSDQQGNVRPVLNACTVGAIEGVSDLIFANGLDASYAGE